MSYTTKYPAGISNCWPNDGVLYPRRPRSSSAPMWKHKICPCYEKYAQHNTLSHILCDSFQILKTPFQNLKTLTSIEKVYQTQPVFNFDQLLSKIFFIKNKYYLAISAQGVGRNSRRSWRSVTCCHPILNKLCNLAMCVWLLFCYHIPPPHKIQADREKTFKAKTTHQHPLSATQQHTTIWTHTCISPVMLYHPCSVYFKLQKAQYIVSVGIMAWAKSILDVL